TTPRCVWSLAITLGRSHAWPPKRGQISSWWAGVLRVWAGGTCAGRSPASSKPRRRCRGWWRRRRRASAATAGWRAPTPIRARTTARSAFLTATAPVAGLRDQRDAARDRDARAPVRPRADPRVAGLRRGRRRGRRAGTDAHREPVPPAPHAAADR